MNTWEKTKHIENHQPVFDPQDFEVAIASCAVPTSTFGDPHIASANHI